MDELICAKEHTAIDRKSITLRPMRSEDLDFVFSVYANARRTEIPQLTHLNSEENSQFLQFQFSAQHQHYQQHYPDASYDIICQHQRPVGRLYVETQLQEIRLMDIALIPKVRNQGIGTALIKQLLHQARCQGRFISLHVEDDNPAKCLFERLGFRVVGDVSFYRLMHWHPQ